MFKVGSGVLTATAVPALARPGAAVGASQLRLAKPQGTLIADVDLARTAAVAGLQPGDVIVGSGGEPVLDSRRFARAIAEAEIGFRFSLVVVRDGRKLPVSVGIADPRAG